MREPCMGTHLLRQLLQLQFLELLKFAAPGLQAELALGARLCCHVSRHCLQRLEAAPCSAGASVCTVPQERVLIPFLWSDTLRHWAICLMVPPLLEAAPGIEASEGASVQRRHTLGGSSGRSFSL